MGLDAVELLMDVEDRFKVTLPDDAFSRVRTVGELAGLVVSTIPSAASASLPGCPTARRFHQLRDHALRVTRCARRAIRPSSRLDAVFPKADRRRLWSELRCRDHVIPHLAASPAINIACLVFAALGLAACVVGAVVLWDDVGSALALSGLIVTAVLGGIAILSVHSRFACCFPARCATMADLVRATLPYEIPADPAERQAAEAEVLQKVREMTAKVLGLDLETVRPESRFGEDLHLN